MGSFFDTLGLLPFLSSGRVEGSLLQKVIVASDLCEQGTLKMDRLYQRDPSDSQVSIFQGEDIQQKSSKWRKLEKEKLSPRTEIEKEPSLFPLPPGALYNSSIPSCRPDLFDGHTLYESIGGQQLQGISTWYAPFLVCYNRGDQRIMPKLLPWGVFSPMQLRQIGKASAQ